MSSFPTLKLFTKVDTSERYGGDLDLAALTTFLNDRAATHRNTDGTLRGEAGLVAALDPIVRRRIDQQAIDDAEAIVVTLADEEAEYAQLYLKAMRKASLH